MEIQILLTAYIVNCGLTIVLPLVQTADQIITNHVNNEGAIQGNFRNLLDSIANNNSKNSQMYYRILEKEVARGRQAFNAMKEEILTAQVRSSYKKKNPYRTTNRGENVVAVKRGADEYDPDAHDLENARDPEVHEPIINDPQESEIYAHDPVDYDPTTTPTTSTTSADKKEFTLHFITIIKIEEAPSYVRQPRGDSKVCRFHELTRLELCKEALQEGFIRGQYKLSKTADMGKETVYRLQYGGLLSSNNVEETVSACRCPTHPPLFLQDGNEPDQIKILIQVVSKVPPATNNKILAV